MKPIITGRDTRSAKKPNLNSPSNSSRMPDSNVIAAITLTYSGVPVCATNTAPDASRMAVAESAPTTNRCEYPNNPNTSAPIIVVYKPVSGGSPTITEKANALGTFTTAINNAVMISCRK